MRWLSVLLLTAVLLLVPAGPARAHVELEQAAPAPGEVVTEAFARVTLTFSGALLEGGEHAVGLFGPDERELDDLSTVTESDRVLSTGVASLPAEGTYTVRWRIFAADGDQQDGSYSFTYAGPVAAETESAAPTVTEPLTEPTGTAAEPTPTAAEPSPTPTEPTAASTVSTPTGEATPQPVESSSDGPGIALAAIAGLAVVAVAGALLARRRRP